MNGEMRTFDDLFGLMERSAAIRRRAARAMLAGDRAPEEALPFLKRAAARLLRACGGGMACELEVSPGLSMEVDLSYEIGELNKDAIYLERGGDALLAHVRERVPELVHELERAARVLGAEPFNVWLTDRDGTTNNYCATYRTSVQSIYNAVYMAGFARVKTNRSVILTSAPMRQGGVLDVSVVPDGSFVHAASKGREYVDEEGKYGSWPIDSERSKRLEELNRELSALVSRPEYEKFSRIGSGLQFKFGQTCLARQNMAGAVDPAESGAFLEAVAGLVERLAPEGDYFRIEDTGYDMEISLTIESGGATREFGKGRAVGFLDRALGLDLCGSRNLVSGDTPSDLPMLEAVTRMSGDCRGIFVTRDQDLASRALEINPKTAILSEPDVLVLLLRQLSGIE